MPTHFASIKSICVALLVWPTLASADVQILFPLERKAYQTNEPIQLAVVRSEASPLAAGELVLNLEGVDDGSRATVAFPLRAVPLQGDRATFTEHLQLNGRLLRPGAYKLDVTAGGKSATAQFEVFSHIRKSTFKTIDWGSRASNAEQRLLGENGLGFNLLYYSYGGVNPDETIRGGIDTMRNCAMSGGHQLDLRPECDWSDPYALQGAAARATRQAFEDRTRPNCIGVHFYDEPGLTWAKYPKTGIAAPFNIPAQDRSYRAAFGADSPQYNDIRPNESASVQRWNDLSRWRMSFMEAAWKVGQFGVNEVRPDYLTATQSMYGFHAYGDGYYFNVARPLSVISGHGGYNDGPGAYFYPPFHQEFGRMRDGIGANKPVWYLPSWYHLSPENYRLEQYLSFMMHAQGLAKPPDILAHKPSEAPEEEGIVEANKLMARLGTIFTTMPLTRPPVAQLYSLSQNLSAEVRDMQDPKTIVQSAYDGGGHRVKSYTTFIAGKLIHIPFMPIVEEDILDGTLAAHHRAVILPGVNHLDLNVITALEQFITTGGAVLLTDDSQVQIKGATKVGAVASTAQFDLCEKLTGEHKIAESTTARGAANFFRDAKPLADALREKLSAIGIHSDFDSDQPAVVTSRQAMGDVEYHFATNATPDETSTTPLALKPAVATLTLANDGRPIYDAIRGKEARKFIAKEKSMSAQIRFGPGQMRVFARTAQPIGTVQVIAPLVSRDYTNVDHPLGVQFSAVVNDTSGQILCGSIPLQIKVIDPLGATRYDLYRATDKGICPLELPLAANDPPGKWKVIVRELLNETEGAATFDLATPSQVGALAGTVPRAISFGNDREQIFRFFRTFEDVTIVPGSGDYSAAVERIVSSLRPWDVRCKVVPVAEASKPRKLSPEESSTWVGLIDGVRKDQKSPPTPAAVGFAVQGPVILLGTPQDNPLIQFAVDQKFLPFKPDAISFPGRGRGMIAWQRDMVGYQQESITLIGYDPAGISEAIGTLYESAAGIEPLMALKPPMKSVFTPANRSEHLYEATTTWRISLPDRAVLMTAKSNDQLIVTTADGSRFTVDAKGAFGPREAAAVQISRTNPAPALPESVAKSNPPGLLAKHVATSRDRIAIAYWGGTVRMIDHSGQVVSSQVLSQDVTQLAWLGDLLVVGLSDGQIISIKP